MKRLKVFIALVAVLAMTIPMTVFAAPSPVAGTVTIVLPGQKGASGATVKQPTQKQIASLANYIAENTASLGMTPNVKSTIEIVAPADYKGGDVPVVFAVSGIKNNAKNVFAYILTPGGKTVIVPCVVKNGYVGFTTPALGTVSIVELNPAVATAATAANGVAAATATAPAKLH